MSKMQTERWVAHRREHNLERRALKIASKLQDQAVELARLGVDHRLEGLNALRQEYTSRSAEFMTHGEYEAKQETVVARLAAIEQTLAALAGRDVGIGRSWGVLVAAIVLLVGVLDIGSRFIGR